MGNRKVLEVEIIKKSGLGEVSSCVVELPATMWELQDALERARITDASSPYTVTAWDSPFEFVSEIIPQTENLYEVNRLAELISDMGETPHGIITAFEALVKMDERDHVPHTIDRLIALAMSTSDVLVAPAQNDKELGDFVVENEMDERLSILDDFTLSMIDRVKIGKDYRESEGGIYLHGMYAVNNGEIKKPPVLVQPASPLGTVQLKISKECFNEPKYDNELTAMLTLPTNDYQLTKAVTYVDAASLEECSFTAVDCIVPELTEKINDELYATEGDCYGLVCELAKSMETLKEQGNLTAYKAMIHAVLDEITLEDALDLTEYVDKFYFSEDFLSSADYAMEQLKESEAPMLDVLIKMTDMHRYGQMLMQEDHAINTPYGILWPAEDITLEQCVSHEIPDIGMEMK